MSLIFISYRRSDSQDVSGRIFDNLETHLDFELQKYKEKYKKLENYPELFKLTGRNLLYKDVDSIPPGADFRCHIRQALSNCKILLAVIGPSWVTATDDQGIKRLENPNDWVRIEIEEALRRDHVLLIPLLVSYAAMPRNNDLPESIKELTSCNAHHARPDPDFRHDMRRLTQYIKKYTDQYIAEFLSGVSSFSRDNEKTSEKDSQLSENQLHQNKSQYYREACLCFEESEDDFDFDDAGRIYLEALRHTLSLPKADTEDLMQKAIRPYLTYAQAFAKMIEKSYPLDRNSKNYLSRLQRNLGLSRTKVIQIQEGILKSLGVSSS